MENETYLVITHKQGCELDGFLFEFEFTKICESEFFIFIFSSSISSSSSLKKTKFIEFEFAALVKTKSRPSNPGPILQKNGLRTHFKIKPVLRPTSLQNIIYYSPFKIIQ